jgi:phosphoketolase
MASAPQVRWAKQIEIPLKPEHIKNRLLGHWGASPGLALIDIHLNRLIKK